MTEAHLLAALKILDIIETAYQTLTDLGADEQDMLALRKQLKGKSQAEITEILQARADALQTNIDELRAR